MLWIGLTGGLGTGKSTVAEQLRRLGYAVVDADQLAHRALAVGSAGLAQVFKTFGQQLRQADGSLDRRALGQIVFSDPKKLAQLEAIVHPLVRAMSESERKRIADEGQDIGFYDVPLLFERQMKALFDAVVVVAAEDDLALARAQNRDGLDRDTIRQRMKSQLPLTQKIAAADFVIANNLDLEALKAEVLRVVEKLRGLPRPGKPQPK